MNPDRVGQLLDKGDYICKGGDWDTNLVVVLSGSVEKLVSDSCNGGRCIVRSLRRGDVEGVVEFLGAGTAQRCHALRAAEEKTRVRLVSRDSVMRLINMQDD